MRHWHKDKSRTERIEREEKTGRTSSPRTPVRARRSDDAPEHIGGRNPVVEALRAGVPASTLYVALRIDNDDRVRESVRIAADRGIAMLEVGREKLDRLTEGGSTRASPCRSRRTTTPTPTIWSAAHRRPRRSR